MLCGIKSSHNLSKLLRRHCTMFQNFLSLNEKPKNVSPSLWTYNLGYSGRPSALSNGPLFDCKLKKEYLTSAKCVWVGALVCVCWRFLAIDDLSRETMKLLIYQGPHAVPSLSSQSSSSVFLTVNFSWQWVSLHFKFAWLYLFSFNLRHTLVSTAVESYFNRGLLYTYIVIRQYKDTCLLIWWCR